MLDWCQKAWARGRGVGEEYDRRAQKAALNPVRYRRLCSNRITAIPWKCQCMHNVGGGPGGGGVMVVVYLFAHAQFEDSQMQGYLF